MNISDLMNYHDCKNKKELSKKTGYSTVTLWKWEKEGIPPRTQATFEVLTKGQLKADLHALNA
ncbi:MULTISPECIES: hypothetical protein [Acinetobacter calcoaceticus/baumannii complex]|uniref:Helix-turn-helix domain-containing protein n=1 Tax=Acinetobacter baumannii TaxID=470 RepID=A0A6L8M4J5_ACIBA|nr:MULTISPECIES: hypothetical protein [Acinetobacter calcoaceticus/baumannii complex]KCY47723.1 hypothetical protein J715_3339 [Acinetobacter baumannii 1571545]MCJ8818967.1 hypothetical protein [Acinetobacter baumannii]MCJ8985561.1 hypothetical protein [Acinetobacter baumannii]MCJ8988249.1 hypothetical protein [Acinetobacter baumannii]MCJ9559159.1 hypothetical protein [Acinetobacter baumannii]